MFVDTRTYSSVDSMIKRESDKRFWVLDLDNAKSSIIYNDALDCIILRDKQYMKTFSDLYTRLVNNLNRLNEEDLRILAGMKTMASIQDSDKLWEIIRATNLVNELASSILTRKEV